METKEKRNDEKKFTEEGLKMSCCGTQGSHEMMPDCCKGIGKADDHCSIMNKCMKGCRWFPIIPVVLGMVLFLLGYYLSPEITRILWMIVAGLVVLIGTFGLLMMSKMKKICCG